MKDCATRTLLGLGAIGVASVVVAATGVAVAAAGSGNTIHGCVAKSNGALRIVHSASHCTSHQKPIAFNRRGPRGPRGPAGGTGGASSGTFQMYANVDQNGDLGSNFDAVSAGAAQEGGPGHGPLVYTVVFSQPVTKCAIIVQTGYADGQIAAKPDVSLVEADSAAPSTVVVQFGADAGSGDTTAFMMTVTCKN